MAEAERDVTKDLFSAHEVLDRAHVISQSFEFFISDHPYVEATPELRIAADRLGEQLAAFYQLAGRFALEVTEDLAEGKP